MIFLRVASAVGTKVSQSTQSMSTTPGVVPTSKEAASSPGTKTPL